MRKFTQWLIESNSSVAINMEPMQKRIANYLQEVMVNYRDKMDQISNFDPTSFLQTVRTKVAKYPLFQKLMQALESKNPRYILDHLNKFRMWSLSLPYKESREYRDIAQKIWLYIDTLEKQPHPDEHETALNKHGVEVLETTRKFMEVIKNRIEQITSNMPNWNNSPITIEALPAENEHGFILEPNDSAHIYVGQGEDAPSFSYFVFEGKLEIDDVIEGGDTDFFKTPQLQADYFNLINELRNPGSTSKGRVLTLYTARPVSDRKLYQDAKTLPVNLFLTNSWNHAEGLAHDLAGSQEPRDVYKVRIDSRYLTQTLDGPIKYYQVTSHDTPVISINLA